MPGLWELPSLRETPDGDARMTLRHAIMNVNYVVRIRDVREEDMAGAGRSGRRTALGAAARCGRHGAHRR